MENLIRNAPSCPRCQSSQVVPFLYGLPNSRGVAMMQRGEVVLSGCVTSGDDPTWCCRDCNASIYTDGERYEWHERIIIEQKMLDAE